jgi:predicted permease
MEDANFTPPVMSVLLGYGLWQDRFGADPTVVGRTLRLNGQAMEVIGVLPERFALHLPAWAQVPTSIDVWALMPVPLTDMGRGVGGLDVVARLADGMTIERARSEMEAVAAELRSTYAAHSESDTRVRVEPLHDEVVGTARPLLWILFGAVGLLLLIAAINVASLILVRAASREREFAVRAALGVTRSRIARQLLAEGLIVSALGAAVGTALAGVLVRILIAARPAELPRLETSSVDGSVLLFTGGVSIVVALVFGLLPMVTARDATAAGLLRGRGTGAGVRAGVRLRRVLVAAELAVSVVLLAGAGLLLRSFAELQRVDPGVDATGVVALDVAVPFFEYRDDNARAAFFVELTRRAGELQGVTAAGVTARLPLEPGTGGSWYAAWGPDGAVLDAQTSPRARYRPLALGALTALGVRFREGRDFERRDEIPGTAVPVIVDVRIADQFPQGAIGRGLRLSIAAYTGLDREVEATIVGVTEPAHFGTLAEVDEPTLFVPYRMFAPVDGTLVVRTTNDPERTAEQVRALVAEIDGGIPVFAVRRFADVVRSAAAEARYSLFLVATFAVLALVLAAVGLYGVVSTLAQQRTREISLRIALGAHGRDIARLVVREGTVVTLPGLVLGLMGAVVVTPLGRSLLFEVQPLDPIALAGTVVLLMTVAWLATVIPARRATHVDPARALREE